MPLSLYDRDRVQGNHNQQIIFAHIRLGGWLFITWAGDSTSQPDTIQIFFVKISGWFFLGVNLGVAWR